MKKWLKRLALVCAVCVVLIVVVVLVATSSWFITSTVVPRVAKTLQTEIRIGDLAFSPASRLQVQDVRVGPADVPLIQSDLMRVRYSLFSALTGKVRVNEVRLDDTTVHLLVREDGTTNLPVFPESKDDDDDDDDEDTPKDVRVADVRLSGLTLIYEQRQGPAQEPISLRVSNLSLEVPEIASGKEGTLTLSGQVDELTAGAVKGVKGTLRGEGRLGLAPTLAPTLVDLNLRMAFTQGSANAIDLAGREVRLEVQLAGDAKALEIRRVALVEAKADHVEAAMAITGRVQREPAELHLEIVADPIESAVFDIAGALAGDVSFGQPTGSYRASIDVQSPDRLRRKMERNMTQSWTVAATGRLDLRSLSPRSAALKLPDVGPLDISAEHDVSWDTAREALDVRTAKARVGAGGKDLLSAELSQPLSITFAGATPTVQGDAVLTLAAHDVALALANPFLPATLPLSPAAGTLDAEARLSVARQGADIATTVTAHLRDVILAAAAGAKGTPFSVGAELRATLADLRRVQADRVDITLRPAGGEPAQIKASGRLDPDQGGEGLVSFSGVRQALLAIAPDPRLAGLPVERCAADGQVRWQAGKGFSPLTADAKVQVAGVRLRGQEGPDELATTLALQATLKPDEIAVQSGSLDVAIGGQPAVQLAADGALGLSRAPTTTRLLSLRSEVVDVDRLLAFAKPLLAATPATAAAPVPASSAAAAPAAGAPASAAPALPPLNGTVSLDLRRIVYNGRSVAVSGTASLAEAADLKALVLRLPAGEIAVEGSVRPDGGDWRARLNVSAAGEALAELASWAGKAVPAEPLSGTALAVRFEGAAAPDASRVRVEALDVRLAQAGQAPMLTIAATKPVRLDRAKDGALTWTDTALTISATKLPLAMANTALPADLGLRLDRGTLDTALDVTLKAQALTADVQGTFTVADLAGIYGEQAFAAIRVEGAVQGQAAGADRGLALSRFETTVTADGAKALAVSGVADWDRAKGGTASLQVMVDVPVALKAAAVGGAQAARVQALALNLTAKAQMAPDNGPVKADFGLSADGIRLADPSGKALPPWALQVAGKTTLGKDQLSIETLTIQAKTAEKTLANLALSGNAALPPLEGRSQAALTGDALDVTGLMAVTLGSQPEEQKTGKDQPKEPTPPAQPAQEPGPFNTGKAVAEVSVDLRNVVYGEVRTDVACTARLENSVITIDPIKGSVNGSAFSGTAKANLAVQGLDYATTFTLAATDWAPFVKTFAPNLASSVQGSLSGVTLELAGQGITGPSLQRHLRGRIDTGAKGITVQGLPGQASLAQKLSVPQIEKIEVTEAEIKARIQNGRVHLETFRETAPDHTLGATGTIGLDESLALDVGLGIGGTLQTTLTQHAAAGYVFRYFTQQGNYMVSPAPLPLEGTVRKPKFNKERFLAELGKAGATSLVQGLLAGKVNTEGGLAGALNDLTGGRLAVPGLGGAAVAGATTGTKDNGQTAPGAATEGPRERPRGKGRAAADTKAGATATEPKAEPAAETVTQKAAEPVTKPAAEKTTKPAAEPAPQKAAEPAVEPAAEKTTKPAAEPAPQKAAEPVTKPAAEKTTKPAAEPAPQKAAEPVAEPAAEKTTEPAVTVPPATDTRRGGTESPARGKQRPRRAGQATEDAVPARDPGAQVAPEAAPEAAEPAAEVAPVLPLITPAAEAAPKAAEPAAEVAPVLPLITPAAEAAPKAAEPAAETPAAPGAIPGAAAVAPAPAVPADGTAPAAGAKPGDKRRGKARRDGEKEALPAPAPR